MSPEKPKQIIIPPDQAVFRLDAQGRWHNQGGPFRKKKIIDHFNTAIGRDHRGYYVGQTRGDVEERVYFPYADTALFVFDVTLAPPRLVLNTGRQCTLVPEDLYIRQDNLYARLGDEVAKFAERALLKLASHLTDGPHGPLLTIDGRNVPIPEMKSEKS